MSINEMTAKVRELKELKAMAEELSAEITAIEDEIKAEMTARNAEEMTKGFFIMNFIEMKAEYIKAITKQLNESNDIGLLDFIFQLLIKSDR